MEPASDRGEFKYKDRAKQLFSFGGMVRRRGITPTDLDGLIDYNGKAFVLLEGKFVGAPFLRGQKMALENIVDALYKSEIEAILLLFNHTVPPEEMVKVAEQKVIMYYYENAWREPKQETTVLDAIEMFEKWCDSKNAKI